MDAQVIGLGMAVLVPVGGCVLYVIRAELRGEVATLKGRVDTQDALHKQLREDVSYIRSRIDEVVGHR